MDSLVSSFDAAVPDLLDPHPRPTEESIAKINAHFGFKLPAALYELALRCTRFSNIFLSFGENYEVHDHVIPYNRYWRTRRRTRKVPSNLVIITNGFMDEDFWCLDRTSPDGRGGYEMQFWSPAPIGFPQQGHFGERLASFEVFVEHIVHHHVAASARRVGA
jgi:hypothetical protein